MRIESERQGLQTIRRALDRGAREIDPSVSAQLVQARERALAGMRRETGLQLAGHPGKVGHSLAPRLRVAFALVGLSLGIFGAYYWSPFDQGDDRVDEVAEVDSALLTDDLPVDAYADQGFQAWLNRTSASQPSP